MRIFINLLTLILSLITAIAGYFTAWEFFWSSWANTPFGYETCGLEGLVWVFFIPEVLFISFLLKWQLVYFCNYPRIFGVYPLIAGVLLALALFCCGKGWGQGLMAALFIICELIIAIYSFFKSTKHLPKPLL